MATISIVDDERAASALADLLNGSARRRPVVVVTIPAGRTEPWIDVEEIAREAGSLAGVYLMPTGPFTWEFSNRMAEGPRSTVAQAASTPSDTSGPLTSRSRRSASPSTNPTENAAHRS